MSICHILIFFLIKISDLTNYGLVATAQKATPYTNRHRWATGLESGVKLPLLLAIVEIHMSIV